MRVPALQTVVKNCSRLTSYAFFKAWRQSWVIRFSTFSSPVRHNKIKQHRTFDLAKSGNCEKCTFCSGQYSYIRKGDKQNLSNLLLDFKYHATGTQN